ncbi:hypothetical protein BC834DRAFT_848767 [Gloeopeniophorella convolvens]|nr:hypothetical protein BC834DRAFT_848767 [Gloeopeniophorella convolvens]
MYRTVRDTNAGLGAHVTRPGKEEGGGAVAAEEVAAREGVGRETPEKTLARGSAGGRRGVAAAFTEPRDRPGGANGLAAAERMIKVLYEGGPDLPRLGVLLTRSFIEPRGPRVLPLRNPRPTDVGVLPKDLQDLSLAVAVEDEERWGKSGGDQAH